MIDLQQSIEIELAQRGKTRYWLAKQLKVNPNQPAKYNNNTKLETVERIAKVFGMKVSQFIALGEK